MFLEFAKKERGTARLTFVTANRRPAGLSQIGTLAQR
jgi:hypothetical protein